MRPLLVKKEARMMASAINRIRAIALAGPASKPMNLNGSLDDYNDLVLKDTVKTDTPKRDKKRRTQGRLNCGGDARQTHRTAQRD